MTDSEPLRSDLPSVWPGQELVVFRRVRQRFGDELAHIAGSSGPGIVPSESGHLGGWILDGTGRAIAREPLLPIQEVLVTARPPFPPFTMETALEKVQAAEDAWNTREPERVALAYTEDSRWRNRDQFITGRAEIIAFLRHKWDRELNYALRKELWGFHGNRIAVRFQYECQDSTGQWWRSYGNELWEFTPEGLMSRREASINDIPITETDRRIRGPRPTEQHGDPLPLR